MKQGNILIRDHLFVNPKLFASYVPPSLVFLMKSCSEAASQIRIL